MALRSWQVKLAIFGTALWMLAMPLSDVLQKHHFPSLYKFNAGYVLGFITAFAGFIFWEFVHGRGSKYIDQHWLFRWLSYCVLAIGALMSLLALIAEVFGDTDWRFNIGALLAGIVVGVGLLPTVEKLDSQRAP
ncbi:hypothetical protein [Xanthomonas arboricola]|uniref:hypothetical protein n=1 Tax=Xanthomonas arboricola TaxID=56448 RepID=UPI0011AFDF58|nr:hypothetical protein [Xanthomonas arboricola]